MVLAGTRLALCYWPLILLIPTGVLFIVVLVIKYMRLSLVEPFWLFWRYSW